MPRGRVEFEHEMGDHRPGEACGWTVLGAKRGELSIQTGHDVASFQQFPAVRVARRGALHHHVDRSPRLSRRDVW